MSVADDHLMSIFSAALDYDSEAERLAYVDDACRLEPGLRARIHALLLAHNGAGRFLASDRNGSAYLDSPDSLENTALHSSPDAGIVVAGRYKLMEMIGEGGMGAVWLAEQTDPIRRRVAIKLIKPGMYSKEVLARFEAERQALALMDHPNIAKVYDAGTIPFRIADWPSDDPLSPRIPELEGRPFFVMELVRGTRITKYCDDHHLTPRQRLELFVPVCHAIQHAHQKGIIHRDLKPSNILVAHYDDKPVAKIIDFGVAKAMGAQLTADTLHTGFGAVIGTIEYMSPEQATLNQFDVDTRSDIYSLGVLLYELLAGSPPFSRRDPGNSGAFETLRLIREHEPTKPSAKLSAAEGLPTLAANRGTEPAKLTKLVRGELDWIAIKALEKDRSRRYGTAAGLAADVERYLAGEAVHAVPPSVGYRLRKFARRNNRSLVSAAILGAMLLVLVGGLAWVVSDRTARRARTALEVNQFLQRAESLYTDNKLPEAEAEVRKAHDVLETAGGDDDLHRRVQHRLTELATAAKLEEIGMDFLEPAGRDRLYAEYLRTFQDYGIDVETLSKEESAARIAASHIKLDLVLALERWASYLHADDRGLDSVRWQRLQAISRAADPDPWRLRYNAAHEARDKKALKEIADGADLSRLRTRVLAALGDSLRAAGDVEASITFLRKVQKRYPADYSINASLAWSLRSLNPPQWDEATAFRRIAVAVRPQSPIANFLLGFSLDKQGKLDDALPYYQTAVDLDPEHAPAQLCLANVLRVRGKPERALVHFQNCVDLRPTDPNPLNGLAWELATCIDPKLRDPARALDMAKNVVELSIRQRDDRDKPGRDRLGSYWNTLGVAHHRVGNLKEALSAFQKSLEFAAGGDGDYVCEDWYFLAMTNWKLDRKDEARKWYDRAEKWMTEKTPNHDLPRFRTEARELMTKEPGVGDQKSEKLPK